MLLQPLCQRCQMLLHLHCEGVGDGARGPGRRRCLGAAGSCLGIDVDEPAGGVCGVAQ
jgi:hypothetical protein